VVDLPNRSYEKGARHEREIVNWYRKGGADLAWRTAGSHSDHDVGALIGNNLMLHQLKGERQNIQPFTDAQWVKVWSYKQDGRFVHLDIAPKMPVDVLSDVCPCCQRPWELV
jgi:hypothetical protein